MARPEKLNPLFRSLRSFKGVGPQVELAFRRLFGLPDGVEPTALDLIMHLPFSYVDRSKLVDISNAPIEETVTLRLHVDRHFPPPKGNRPIPHRVQCHDESGQISLVFFGNKGGWIERSLPVGEKRMVSGQIGLFQGQRQITHPDLIVTESAFERMPPYEPVYPSVAGLNRRVIARIVDEVLPKLPQFSEWIGSSRLNGTDWPTFGAALFAVHRPSALLNTDPKGPARSRLAYDEYLAGQVSLQIVRSQLVKQKGKARAFTGTYTRQLVAALPFTLTEGQEQAIADISHDLASSDRMSRLVQGDVGAGKTVVALMAMCAIAESGGQSALMAPTEILATQHHKTIAPLCEKIGLRADLITGKMGAVARREVLARLASGETHIIVGTHALFQSDVAFKDLALVVVDEQHRFGVHQRLALSEKGQHSDLLVMTATPIPRTLVLTHFGDMAVSQLRGKPAGRQPIDTAMLNMDQYERVVARLKARADAGAQAYWVCPLVEESEEVNLVSAEDRFAALSAQFGPRVGLIHGRMSTQDKQDVMARFQAGELSVLVATTVIEVGVDVPNASIMVIEHAERFGLSQLHQLRGRVGRGSAKSSCLLLYKDPLNPIATARLETICATEDGFEIAEQDLKLRGQGDLLGTRQSGMPGYTLALPEFHGHLLEHAHKDAVDLLQRNPTLQGPEGDAVRELLYVFRRDLAIPLIRAG